MIATTTSSHFIVHNGIECDENKRAVPRSLYAEIEVPVKVSPFHAVHGLPGRYTGSKNTRSHYNARAYV